MRNLASIIYLLMLLASYECVAQDEGYLIEGTIGDTSRRDIILPGCVFPYRSVSEWKNERFIFMPSPKAFQFMGYISFSGGEGEFGMPTHNECAGKIGTVSSVSNDIPPSIIIMMDLSEKVYSSSSGGDSFGGIACVRDLDSARARWEGATLWPLINKLMTYDESKSSWPIIKIKKLTPLKVIRIGCAWDNKTPVRIVLQTPDGQEGFVDVNVSGTNIPEPLKDTFYEKFVEEDLHAKYKWPKSVWQAIEESRLLIGMNTRQAELCVGKPMEINTTLLKGLIKEQWVYENNYYLYFQNDTLTAIQK